MVLGLGLVGNVVLSLLLWCLMSDSRVGPWGPDLLTFEVTLDLMVLRM